MAPALGLCVGLGSWPDNRHVAANAENASFGNSFIPASRTFSARAEPERVFPLEIRNIARNHLGKYVEKLTEMRSKVFSSGEPLGGAPTRIGPRSTRPRSRLLAVRRKPDPAIPPSCQQVIIVKRIQSVYANMLLCGQRLICPTPYSEEPRP